MLQYLTKVGRSDLVYLMMKQPTYPGWGYMISQGASTCWEQWNGYWSNIHSCFTSAGGWFYTGVAGIGQLENSVAFKHLRIVPQLTDKISEQTARFDSPYGKVLVSWNRKKDNNLQLKVEIPVNTKADLFVPVSEGDLVYESEKQIVGNEGIKILSKQIDQLQLQLKSGKYTFDIRKGAL
jgi:alpha-L-rhamnosidase